MKLTINALSSLLLEQMKEYAIILLDPDGAIVWLNGSAEQTFGHKLEKVAGKKADLLFLPEDVARGVFEHEMKTAAAQGAMENDRWLVRADGGRFWANGAMFPLRSAEGEVLGFAKMLRNRTDVKQQLDTLRNEIATLAEERMKVLAIASHELRNPLFAATIAVDAIRRLAPQTAELKHSFGVIDRQFQAIRRLLDDITDATLASSGKVNLELERIDLRQAVIRALGTMRPAIESRRHTVQQFMLPVAIPVDADAHRLQQVVMNLLGNAIKYTPAGGHIGVEATVEQNEAVLKIEDDGVGIAADMQAHIFELFTRAPQPRNMDEKGLGIGLALVRNLVALHGGTAQVRSSGPGRGSEFTVRLPLAGAAEEGKKRG